MVKRTKVEKKLIQEIIEEINKLKKSGKDLSKIKFTCVDGRR